MKAVNENTWAILGGVALFAALIFVSLNDEHLKTAFYENLVGDCKVENTPHPVTIYEEYKKATTFNTVVKTILSEIEKRECFDERQELSITFNTNYRGVRIPDHLKERYPEEITIILQYQYYDLSVHAHDFSVALYFNGKREIIYVPYNSISYFGDYENDYVWNREIENIGKTK